MDLAGSWNWLIIKSKCKTEYTFFDDGRWKVANIYFHAKSPSRKVLLTAFGVLRAYEPIALR